MTAGVSGKAPTFPLVHQGLAPSQHFMELLKQCTLMECAYQWRRPSIQLDCRILIKAVLQTFTFQRLWNGIGKLLEFGNEKPIHIVGVWVETSSAFQRRVEAALLKPGGTKRKHYISPKRISN